MEKTPVEIATEALALVEEAGLRHSRYTASESKLLGIAQDALTRYVETKGA